MINVLIGLLAFVFMLSAIVVIHELGHYLTARMFGVHAHEFSIGMGPALYQKQGKNTLFSIRAIPLGGYVMLAGEDGDPIDEEDDAAESTADGQTESAQNGEAQIDEDDWLSRVPDDQKLCNKPAWQQIIVLGAGVFMNLVLALALMTTVFAIRGYVSLPALPIVESVYEDSAAAEGGLQPGDRIVKIVAQDGTTSYPETLNDVSEFCVYNHGESVFTVERDGSEVKLKMTPRYDEESQVYLLGFTAQSNVKKINALEAVKYGWEGMWSDLGMMARSLGNLFRGKGVDQMSGPVGIYKMTDQIVSYGWLSYLSFIALISLNIGLFNLLPVPALDGGRIFMVLWEKLFRRKIPQKVVTGLILGSYVLVFGLLIFATWNDLVRYFF